jgi:hypothetical protein
MEFPQIPTDSLYKFMALSGLAIILAFILFPGQKLLEIEMQSIGIQGEYKISCLEFDESTKELKVVSDRQEKILAEYNRIIAEHDLSNATVKRVNDLKEKVDIDSKRAHEKLTQKQIAQLKTDTKLAELHANGAFFRTTLNILTIGTTIGIFMAIFGFYFWYTKIQALQDKLLAMQLETSAPNPPLNSDPTATV